MKRILCFVLMALLLASMSTVAAGQQLEKVNFLLNWTIAADHAPYYVGLKKGWYAEAGLDLNIIIGKGSGFSTTSIDQEMADIAIADAPVVFKFRNDGAQAKIIGIIFDAHPNGMFFWNDSGIKEPKDIAGKTVAVPATDGHKVMWPAFAAMIGVDPNSVEFVNIEPTAKVSALASRNADVVFELLTGIPNFEAAIPQGGFSWFHWAEYGFNSYAHSYITNDKTIAERPEMLRKFLDVTYRAWEWTLNNPEEAIQILSEYQPINTADLTKSLMIEMAFLKTPRYKEHGMGYIDPAQVQATYDLVDTYQVDLTFPVEDIYTAEFLPETPYNNFELAK
ncbi:MAG TPA: ABC transporter substrate-binding protein [Candidatus Limnocylindria bacterium]|nr:ABC transporter substrate-binding protein [Candidatus Limnocylindria bacterium]